VLADRGLCREGVDLEGLTLADLDRPELRKRLEPTPAQQP
jgi:hypothetical protein